MILTVQELIMKLDGFEDGATVQVENDGVDSHISDIKMKAGNAILIINSEDDENEEDDD
ncbi:hypothetical protein ACSQ6I_03725 [Anabaena sp. WFMT]|uniref:hypothetical protein n=1 Tax=Anabaena sp. WFMT TaxID=3449730 RepID=UPI003F292D17